MYSILISAALDLPTCEELDDEQCSKACRQFGSIVAFPWQFFAKWKQYFYHFETVQLECAGVSTERLLGAHRPHFSIWFLKQILILMSFALRDGRFIFPLYRNCVKKKKKFKKKFHLLLRPIITCHFHWLVKWSRDPVCQVHWNVSVTLGRNTSI